MEKDIALGSVGGVSLSLTGGKAIIELHASESVLNGAVAVKSSNMASVDSTVLVDMLFKEIEAKSPPGAVLIEESVKNIVKSAVAAIQ